MMLHRNVLVLLSALTAKSLTVPKNTGQDVQRPPKFIVLAGDHGTGSSKFCHFLSKHPCVVDISEPFSPAEKFASKSGNSAFFTFNGNFGALRSLHKLKRKVEQGAARRGCNALPFKFLSHVKEHTSLTDLFDDMYEEVAQCVELPRECNGHMVLSHKMFPIYADDNNEYILPYLLSDDRTIVHLQRNEKDRQESMFRRFPHTHPWDGKNVSDWDMFLNRQERGGSFSSVFYAHVHAENLWPTATTYIQALQRVFEAFQFERQDSLMQAVYDEVERYYAQPNVRKLLELDD